MIQPPAAAAIAAMLKDRIDQKWGFADWEHRLRQFITAERGKLLPVILKASDVRRELGTSQVEFSQALDWLVSNGLAIAGDAEDEPLLISPQGYAWISEACDFEKAKQQVLGSLPAVIKARMGRSVPTKRSELNPFDATYLLLLILAKATSEQSALRIDRTGETSAAHACSLLNYLLDQTGPPGAGSHSWTVEKFHNYGRSKQLDKKTAGAVFHNNWRGAESPRAWIRENAPETIPNLLSAVLKPLDAPKVIALLRANVQTPIYANGKVGPAASAFTDLFGRAGVPYEYRRRLVALAEAASGIVPA